VGRDLVTPIDRDTTGSSPKDAPAPIASEPATPAVAAA
jgi:hypothetical protein